MTEANRLAPIPGRMRQCGMDEPQPLPPHVRLQQLQAIPEKERTDEQWDELNELEIKLASVNQQGAPAPGAARSGGAPAARPDHWGRGRPSNQGKKFHRRPPRPV